jgi:hypothetical protein
MEKQLERTRNLYPIPANAFLIISTEENTVTAEDLVSLAMHLSLSQPERKLQYWIRLE